MNINVNNINSNDNNVVDKTRKNRYFTPTEIKEIIDEIPNAQDKALVLLTYLGLYNKDFELMRNIKNDDFELDYLVVEGRGNLALSNYSSKIIMDASLEEYNTSLNDGGITENKLRETEFLFRARATNRSSEDRVSPIYLKKRFIQISKYLGIPELTPMAVKKSRLLYDGIKLELKTNQRFIDDSVINRDKIIKEIEEGDDNFLFL